MHASNIVVNTYLVGHCQLLAGGAHALAGPTMATPLHTST